MGLIVSGEVSDASLHSTRERATVLNNRFRTAHLLKSYFRFKDDMWAVVGNDGEGVLPKLVATFKSHAKWFRIKVEEIKHLQRCAEEESWTSFLDLELCPRICDDGTYRFEFRPYKKPTSVWTPLSHESRHHPSVHRSWPKAYIARLHRHSTARPSFEFARDNFVSQLKHRCVGHPGGEHVQHQRRFLRHVKKSVSYVVMPFQPLWNGVTAVLSTFDSTLRSMKLPIVRVAWSLGGSHLGKMLKSFSKQSTLVSSAALT